MQPEKHSGAEEGWGMAQKANGPAKGGHSGEDVVKVYFEEKLTGVMSHFSNYENCFINHGVLL